MIKPFLIRLLLLGGLISGLFSCKEFIEPSIEKRVVVLQAPGDGFQSTLYKVNFWWDEVEDALGYRLQVAYPDFNSPDRLVIDTLVKGYQFAFNMEPGHYSWRVRAENGSSATAYSVSRHFSVVASSITQQAVELSSPADQLLTNRGSLSLQWGALYGATRYRLEIDTNGFADETRLVLDQTGPATEVNLNVRKDQRYQWRVQALNDTAQAKWSSIRTFTVDRVPPGRVTAVTPGEGELSTKPVTLTWNAVSGASRYKVYVLKTDSVTRYNEDYPLLVNGMSHSVSLGNSNERIYWKVAAIDAAGNEGKASAARSFTIR